MSMEGKRELHDMRIAGADCGSTKYAAIRWDYRSYLGHDVLAHKWFYGLVTCTVMSIEVEHKLHDMRIYPDIKWRNRHG